MEISTYKKILADRIFVFDGAMGTNLQRFNPTLDDYHGKEGCTEILCTTRPQWIKEIHSSFFQAGCDIVETNSFGANRVVFAEFGLENEVIAYNKLAAELAKEAAQSFNSPAHPRFVAGSMGPGTKLPSLGHIDFDTLRENYAEQAEGLLLGGVDLLLIETCQDLLQVKAAINGALDAQKKLKIQVPLNVQVTVESTGTMLIGSDMATAITALESFPIHTIGLNCATGPTEMSEHVRTLSQLTSRYISVLPNAGLPENVGGHAVYKLTPQDFAIHVTDFVTRFGANVVGGCCGTTAEHLKALVEKVKDIQPLKREIHQVPAVSSLYMSVPLRQEPAPLLVGERTNANGSKLFRDLLNANDYDGIVAVAKEQEAEGAHVLDVCTAYVGRDEKKDITETVSRLTLQVRIPLMIDSTEVPVIEAALKLVGGKAIINSINLEDGEDRCRKIIGLAKTYGAALVALTIDEQGMAKTTDRKLSVAKRLYDIAVTQEGMDPGDIIFDCLTFTLGSGEEEFRQAGMDTIKAIRQIKQEMPRVQTILGVSNISFGLNPLAREVINSVFLHYSVEAGLDAAIVNAKKITPLFKVEAKAKDLAEEVIFDRRKFSADGTLIYDPLKELIAYFTDAKTKSAAQTQGAPKNVEEDLHQRIVNGNKQGIEKVLLEALNKYPALDIINNILLEGMRVVGDLFGKGQIQLPFVLQSAETMKAAVKVLEPHIPKQEGSTSRGTMVLATVKGDVHDIGKNLVDIILTNNGYNVINLGIKQPLENILKAAEEHHPQAIGLSGLLVKSTAVMKENLEEMTKRNISYDVILGGAALTRKFVDVDLRSIYKGRVFYAKDAFEGLNLMEELTNPEIPQKLTGAYQVKTASPTPLVNASVTTLSVESGAVKKKISVKPAGVLPVPPFWGSRVVRGLDMKEVFSYINETALLKVRWGFKRVPAMSTEDYDKLMTGTVYPLYEKWKNFVLRENVFQPMVVYGYFPCAANENELLVYPDQTSTEAVRFPFPRQKKDPGLCITDFFRSNITKERDVVGLMVVTIGEKASTKIQEIFKNNSYSDYLYLHGLSVETAEALAEYWHKRMREELGIASKDSAQIRGLFHQEYQGSRYSFGYPACPDLEEQKKLFFLLNPLRIGVSLSEECQMHPEQSVSAMVVHHEAAKYFSVE